MDSQLATGAGQQTFFTENVPAAIAMFDTEMRYLAVSRRFLSAIDFLGSPAEVIGRSHYETFPDMPPHWREYHARVLAGERMAHAEERLPRRDGRIDWVRWSMKPWHTADGGIGGALLATELITEEIKAKHAIAESKEYLQLCLSAAPLGSWQYDPTRRVFSWDAQAKEILGATENDARLEEFMTRVH